VVYLFLTWTKTSWYRNNVSKFFGSPPHRPSSIVLLMWTWTTGIHSWLTPRTSRWPRTTRATSSSHYWQPSTTAISVCCLPNLGTQDGTSAVRLMCPFPSCWTRLLGRPARAHNPPSIVWTVLSKPWCCCRKLLQKERNTSSGLPRHKNAP
jgi:hypothetical protein